MLRRAILAVFVTGIAVLVAVSSARGDSLFFLVTTTADGPSTCAPYQSIPGVQACPTLRGAVSAADANPGSDVIVLQNTGVYALSQGVIPLVSDVSIHGQNAQLTTLVGNGQSQIFTVASGVSASISGVTLSGGRNFNGNGGNVLNREPWGSRWSASRAAARPRVAASPTRACSR